MLYSNLNRGHFFCICIEWIKLKNVTLLNKTKAKGKINILSLRVCMFGVHVTFLHQVMITANRDVETAQSSMWVPRKKFLRK